MLNHIDSWGYFCYWWGTIPTMAIGMFIVVWNGRGLKGARRAGYYIAGFLGIFSWSEMAGFHFDPRWQPWAIAGVIFMILAGAFDNRPKNETEDESDQTTSAESITDE